jgi:Leucine-rich repeat (LRR) protein
LEKLQQCILNDNQLSGGIPSSINKLTELAILDVSGNNLTGNIPSMTALTQLAMLDASNNNFAAAALPAFLSELTNLQDLRLRRTNLNGALPATLQSLTKLNTLDISGNSFTGSIPNWSAMTNLRVLYAYNASLSGAIPSFIANLPALEWLALDNNGFTGTIPNGSYAKLEKLWLINNLLTGDIPASIKNNTKWSTFHVCTGNSLNNCSGDDSNPADRAAAAHGGSYDNHPTPGKEQYYLQ